MGLVETGLNTVEESLGQLRIEQADARQELRDFKKEILESVAKIGSAGQGSTSSDPMHGQNNGSGGPPPLLSGGFFRVPDSTILFCNTEGQAKLARPKFHASVLSLATEAGLDVETLDLIGDPLDDRFEIKFKGEHRLASIRCHQFFSSLQLGRGKWKKQACLDDMGNEVRFFISPDKNPAQIRKEVLSKVLKDLVQSKLASKQVWLKKATGTLFVDRRKLCIVHVPSENSESTRVEWLHPKRIELGLDDAVIATEFKAAIATREGQSS